MVSMFGAGTNTLSHKKAQKAQIELTKFFRASRAFVGVIYLVFEC